MKVITEALAIVIIGSLVGLGVKHVFQPEKRPVTVHHASAPPPGFKIQQSGSEFRYVTPDGFKSMSRDSYQEAVDGAWAFLKAKNQEWTDL